MNIYTTSCALLLISGLGACTSLTDADVPILEDAMTLPAGSQVHRIDSIEALRLDPQSNQAVELVGTVRQRVPLLEGWIYELEDETGQIWVLTQASNPTVGETAQVRGIVQYEQILIEDVDISEYYLEEINYASSN